MIVLRLVFCFIQDRCRHRWSRDWFALMELGGALYPVNGYVKVKTWNEIQWKLVKRYLLTGSLESGKDCHVHMILDVEERNRLLNIFNTRWN